MIGKIIKGSTFRRCVLYVMGKDEAKLLDTEGVLNESAQTIIQSFYSQTLMNPNIKRPVGHIALSYSKNDAPTLTDERMVDLAKEYMQKMGIKDTQYIIVRHNDREHPHVHLVFNRVDNNGKTISDSNDRYRNERVCKELKEKYGLYFAQGKEAVNLDRLRGRDKTKYEIYHAVKNGLKEAKSWRELQVELAKQGVEVKFKYKGQTDEVQGISFIKDELIFKGSEVDRAFSFSKIDYQLGQNNRSQKTAISQQNQHQESESSQLSSVVENVGSALGGLLDIQPGYDESEAEALRQQRKKKKKKGIRR